MHGLICTCYAFKQVNLLSFFTFVVAAAIQDDDIEDVAAQAEDCSDEHDPAIDVSWVHQSFDCFGEKPY